MSSLPLATKEPAEAGPPRLSLSAWSTIGRDLATIALYVPLTLGFFWQFTFLPNIFLPKGGGDLASFLYPVYSFAARSIQQGHFPLWNPYLYGGSPFAADIQSGVLYPINLIAFWLVRPFTYAAIEWLAVVHYFLAATLTYLYLRGLGCIRPAAFGGGLVFAFSGFLVAHLGHLNMIEAAVWLPLILLCFHRALSRSSLPAAVAAGLAYGVSILAGHTQVSLMIGLFLACYWLWHIVVGIADREGERTPPPAPLPEAERGNTQHEPTPLPDTVQERTVATGHPASQQSNSLSPWERVRVRAHPPALARLRSGGLGPTEATRTPHPSPFPGGEGVAASPVQNYPSMKPAPGRGSRPLIATLLFAVTGAVALGAAAWQLLPAAELVQLSLRADLTYARAAEYAASPLGFVTFLIPHFFGRDNLGYWGLKGSLVEVYGYAGILPLMLAAIALILPRRGGSWRRYYYLAAAGLFLLLSIGEQTPLHGWLYRFIPGFDKVRAPGRFVLLVDFAIAVLAAHGLQVMASRVDWRDRPYLRRTLRLLGAVALLSLPVAGYFYRSLLMSQDKDPTIFQRIQLATDSLSLTIVFLLAGLGLLWAWSRRSGRFAFAWIAVGLIVLDLFAAGSRFNPTDQNVIAAFEHPEVVRFLKSDQGPYRIDSVTNVWDVWQPDTSLLHGIDDVMGIYNPMMLADWDRYWANLGSRSGRAYDLLNAKYVIAHKDVQLDWSKFRPVLTDAPKVNVYENTKVLPRALLIPAAEALPREQILACVRQPDFDPTQTLFLEGNAAILPSAPTEWQHDVLSIEYPSPNEVVVRTRTSAPGYLLLSDVYYPGWRARLVDGRPTDVHRGDFIFRAVALPAGDHVVHFTFAPRRWAAGVAVSAATWLAAFALGIWLVLRRRRGQPSTRREAV